MTHTIVLNSLPQHFGDQRAIPTVSLDVQPGTVFRYLEPNRAGMSTTIRLLRPYQPVAGRG